MDLVGVGIVSLDARGTVLDANSVFLRMLGRSAAEVIGAAIDELVDVTATEQDVECWQPRGSQSPGRSLTALLTPAALDPSPGGGLSMITQTAMVFEDEQILALRALRPLSDHSDAVTGLMSRSRFLTRLAEETRIAQERVHSLALLWIDIDNFKAVNDRLGYPAGDLVLQVLTRRLQELTRQFDVVARVGGDEFALLMIDDLSLDSIETMVERIRLAIREPLLINDQVTIVTASIGVALCPVDGQTPEELLRHADTAMHAAKDSGLDRAAYFRREMHEVAEQRADVRHRLMMAVRENSFTMLYQPIVSVTTGRVTLAESLLRWMEGDSVHPASYFVHLAESAGLLGDLSRITLERVSTDLESAHDRQPLWLLPISINLSPLELQDRSVVDHLAALSVPGGLSRLVVEVTESAVLSTGSRALDSLRRLQQLGIALSIDDFGSGYSSIDLLERLRPTSIKVDKSLMLRTEGSPGARALLAATVSLAKALRATTTLEGIETEAHWNLACELGADFVQGYWISHPITLDQLIDFEPSLTLLTD